MPTKLAIRKDLFDKYSMPSGIKSFDELDAAFDKILNDDKVIPVYAFNPGSGNTIYSYYIQNSADFYSIGTASIPGAYTSDFEVINQYESDHFKAWIKWARKAYQKGWIEKNATTKTDDSVTDLKSGKYASIFNSGGPQGQAGMNQQYATDKYTYAFIDFGVKPTLKTSQIQGTMNSISSTTKNKERAMMLLNLINTDKELYNTMCFGIQGQHYVLKDGFREFPEGVTADNSRYFPQTPWAFANTYNQYLEKGQDPKLFENQKAYDAKAASEPAIGFNYDATGVKTQFAQVTSVLEEFLPSLVVGAVDPDIYLPKMLDKLKTAGVEKIIEDKQAQLDKFMADKK
jgi:putative aldouronate transport system substrate-binding protein